MTFDKSWSGMNLREYAAIHLGVPDSGDAELDAMIRRANRRDMVKSGWSIPEADALLSALEAKP